MFTDSHCHLYDEYYDNLDNILKISEDNKVNRFINNGYDSNTNKEVLDEVIKQVYLSISDNYDINKLIFTVNNEEIYKSTWINFFFGV